MSKKQTKQYNSLSKAEKKIFDSIMDYFPDTSFYTAYDIAIAGGIEFQFISKI